MSRTCRLPIKTIDSFAAMQPKSPLQPYPYEPIALGDFDIELEITHCGICHSDLHLINNDGHFPPTLLFLDMN